ncbi:MAG TPA: hypothetical protein DIW41_00080, partial [Lachnospiraceae bacterium]|nr:hypothetical protein [Lachnospiraceae bacterium]
EAIRFLIVIILSLMYNLQSLKRMHMISITGMKTMLYCNNKTVLAEFYYYELGGCLKISFL